MSPVRFATYVSGPDNDKTGAGEGIRTLDPNLGNDWASAFRRLLKYAPVRFITAFPIFSYDRALPLTL
jgi:hypothetical protein